MEFDPNEKDFEKIRHYPADELTVDQMSVIASNKDQLNDEEKEAFSYVLEDEEFVEEASDDEETETDKTKTADKEEDKPNDNTPSFKTQAEVDAYIKAQAEKAIEETKKKADGGTTTQTDDKKPRFKVDDPTWKASSPAELYDEIELKRQTLATEATTAKEQRDKEVYSRLDSEIDGLTKSGKIPARDTEEGKKAISQMADLAKKYNYESFNDAYDLWSKLPVEHGGGYDPVGAATRAEASKKKDALNKQKAAASRISAGKGDVSGNKPKPLSYNEMKGMHLDDITEHALKQYGR